MIFNHGVMRNQKDLEQGTINHIFTEIKKRRIEPTSEADGKGSVGPDLRELSLRDLSIKALVSQVTPTDLGFKPEELPTDIRLEIFGELIKQDMPDTAVKLLEHSNINFVRLPRTTTDKAIELLANLCPNLESIYLRSHFVTIKSIIYLMQTCPGIHTLDLGWTKIFDYADAALVTKFFETLPPTLHTLMIRATGPRHFQLRVDLLCKYGVNLKSLNIGRLPLKRPQIVSIVSACTNLDTLFIDRVALGDDDIQDLVQICGPRLKYLDVGDSNVTDKGLIAIAQHCPNLETIGLRNLVIVEEGIISLCQSAPKLKSIDLGGCYESTDTAITAISKLTDLEEINLEGLVQITENSIKDVLDHCKKINRIEIPLSSLVSKSFRLSVISGREWRGRKIIQLTGYNNN